MTTIDTEENLYWTDDIAGGLQKIIQKGNYSQLFALCDENSFKYCFPKVEAIFQKENCILIMAGEENKDLSSCHFVWHKLLESQADRNSLLVNIGGGMITDLGGFCASTFKRGIDFVNIPTTLLAIVDASVGGKTAIDFEGVKNVIGTFSKPEDTLIYPGFLNTLSERQLKSGFAEMLKHALLMGGEHYERLFHPEFFFSLINGRDIVSSIRFKAEVVKSDFKEQGIRRQLNIGHSLGHAFESYYLARHKHLLHGEAVAAGLLAECYISTLHDELPSVYLDILTPALTQLFKWTPIPQTDFEELISYIKQDKKNSHNTFQFALIRKPGEWFNSNTVKESEIIEAIRWMNELK
jgi:3-dehydroquinate synthase